MKWALIIHAVLCLWTYSIVLFGESLHRPAMIALFYEASTVLLNLTDMLRFFEFHQIKRVIQFIFAAAFFYCRLYIGSMLLVEMYAVLLTGSIPVDNIQHIPRFSVLSAVCLISLFWILNVHWMWVIVRKMLLLIADAVRSPKPASKRETPIPFPLQAKEA